MKYSKIFVLFCWLLAFVYAEPSHAEPKVWLDGKQVVNADHLTLDVDLTLTGGGRILTTANGDIQLLPNGTGITKVGDAGTTSHSLDSNDDLIVTGELEVNGALFADSPITFASHAYFASDSGFYMGTSNAALMMFNTDQTLNSLMFGTGTDSNAIIIAERADLGTDFGHAQQTNPTIIGHSADATDTTQWWSLTHDQTDHVQGIGSGNKVTHHEAPVSVADNASFNLPDASTGFGTFLIGNAQEYAVVSWTSAGAVTIQDSSANVVTTDTDANLCFIDGGTQVSIKNRLGSELEVMFDYHYTE